MNIEKNYYRDQLLNLMNKTAGKPILVSGVLQYKTHHGEWVTFTNIKPYREGVQTNTLCQHLNFRRSEIEKWAIISSHQNGMTFYLVGLPSRYRSVGGMRGCLELYRQGKFPPVFICDDLTKYHERLKNSVYELTGYDVKEGDTDKIL